ncbi:MAG: glycosyltransferase family 4 protein [Pseudomonadota bacterium]
MSKVYFFYPKGKKLTGQEMASRLILSSLPDIVFEVRWFPAFERGSGNYLAKVAYPFRVTASWLRVFSLVFVPKPVIYVNLSQTRVSLLRDGQPFRMLSWFKALSLVVSLHGHVFTTWETEDRVCRLFVSILKKAQLVTVLGEVQRQKLIDFGIARERVRIVPNTCGLSKFAGEKSGEEVNVLYLSNLIEQKGYLEYLESLELLATMKPSRKVRAVLCGDLYSGESDNTNRIDELIATVNTSESVTLTWQKSAFGSDKEAMFRNADIFVLPSRARVEAQPIVLIEAMASGCALITSRVGEIPSTVSESCAVLLDNVTPADIAAELRRLIGDEQQLRAMQTAALCRFSEKFDSEIYTRNWREIFRNLSA